MVSGAVCGKGPELSGNIMERIMDARSSDVSNEVSTFKDALSPRAAGRRKTMGCTKSRARAVLVPAIGFIAFLVKIARSHDQGSLQVERRYRR